MDPKELKNCLKAARESIRHKDYKEALKCCQTILKTDKDNYNALVFVGVAAEGLEQHEQALAAYRKAVEVDDSQILAWHGMCSFFEKQNRAENNGELATVYQRLLVFFESEPVKQYETRRKLADLYENMSQIQNAFNEMRKLVKYKEGDVDLELWKAVIHLFHKSEGLSSEDLDLVEQGFQVIIKDTSHTSLDRQKLFEEYVQLLVKLSHGRERLKEECNKLIIEYPDSMVAYGVLCNIYMFSKLDKMYESSINPDDLREQIGRINPSSELLSFLLAINYMESRKLSDAKELMLEGIRVNKDNLPAFVMLAEIHLLIHDIQSAEKFYEKVKQLLQKGNLILYGTRLESVQNKLDKLEVSILFEKGQESHYEKALNLVETVLRNKDYFREGLALKANLLLELKKYEEVEEILKELEIIDPVQFDCSQGRLHLISSHSDKAVESFKKVLVVEENNSTALFHLGKLYWHMYETDASYGEMCLSHLLKAAKSDPYHSATFLYLGYFYARVHKDHVKAKKCYQKAYNLDNTLEEVGVALVDVLNLLEQEAQALEILKKVTSRASAGTCKWAWLRLGLYYLKFDDSNKSITSLQSALRADPADYHCWECLGEAYLKRGSYTAACKAFTKATDLQPQSIYAFYQIASIKLTLGVYPEAVEDYKKILEVSTDYVPALKGLGESRFLQCKAALREFFHGRAVDFATDAIFQLARAAYKRPDLSCLWKLLGDCCTILNVIPAEICEISVPAVLLGSVKSIDELVQLDKMEILALGSRCYGMALKCQPDCAALYSDLGTSYYNHSLIVTDKMTSKGLMSKAFQALEKSLQLDSGSHKQWNALGLVALSKDIDNKGLAQHCFIKSIQMEPNNVVAWTNLGILYMQSEEIQLAHEAFKVAQSLEPSYVASWIGQALIAETVGQGDEAMDLFRHSTGLTPHTEGSLGYAHYVCTILQDKEKAGTDWNKYIIEHMYAVTAASDVLEKYTDRVKTNFTAFNLYGLLLERQKLYKNSAKAFETAVHLLKESRQKEELRKAKLNLARVLILTSNFDKAIQLYEDIGAGTNFEEKCSYALALYKMEFYSKSFEQYEGSLSLVANEAEKSHIYAAMGMVKYQMGMKELGHGDIEGAKTQLFKCIQCSSPSIHGLNGLLSLGLIQSDLTLASAAVEELTQFVKPDTSHDFIYMVASLHALKGETLIGKRALAKLIHRQPHKASSWRYIVQYLLTHETDLTDSVSRCCHIGLAMDIKNQHKDMYTWLSLALLGIGQHSRNEAKYNCHSAAQKAVFLYPDSMENWVALISTMYAEMIAMRCLRKKEKLCNSILPLITHFMAKVEGFLSQKEGNTPRLQALHLWCVKQYVVSLIASDRSAQAKQFLEQALWLYEDDEPLQNLLAFLNQNFSVLKVNAINDFNGFTRQMLVKLYLTHGLVKEAEETFKMWLPQARTKPRRILALVRLGFFAFKQIFNTKNTDDMHSVFTEAYDECMKIDSQISIMHFMLGIISVLSDDKKQSRKSLQTSLKYYNENHHLVYGKSMARKQLLQILVEKEDEEGIKELLLKANNEGDEEFLAFAGNKVDVFKYAKQESEEQQ